MTIDIEKAKGVDLEAARKALAALQREKQKQRERLLLGIEVKQRIDQANAQRTQSLFNR